MKNPLNKRYFRELKNDFGKYIALCLFLIVTIGFCSGFLVADGSTKGAYDESFEKYNIEDGHFILAKEADFFSIGTNDLTQMTFGYSRDDIASFLPIYLEKKILKVDPFQVLDQNGVGQLVRMATEKGRAIRPDLKCGICGEHGGEPSSVKFCHKVGLNYVSCSPFRVPIARLAAAQAAIEE